MRKCAVRNLKVQTGRRRAWRKTNSMIKNTFKGVTCMHDRLVAMYIDGSSKGKKGVVV